MHIIPNFYTLFTQVYNMKSLWAHCAYVYIYPCYHPAGKNISIQAILDDHKQTLMSYIFL